MIDIADTTCGKDSAHVVASAVVIAWIVATADGLRGHNNVFAAVRDRERPCCIHGVLTDQHAEAVGARSGDAASDTLGPGGRGAGADGECCGRAGKIRTSVNDTSCDHVVD